MAIRGWMGFAAMLLAGAFLQGHAQQAGMDALIADGHYLRARPLVEAALAKNPNDVHALAQRSVLEWAFFRYDEAIATAEKAVALADKSAEAHTQLTNALGAKLAGSNAGTMEKLSRARRFRKEAELSVSLDPNSAGPTSLDAVEDLARFYWEAPGMVGGDKGKARELAERVGRMDPARGAALKAGFAADEKDKGKRDAAIEALWRAAVAARPESAEAHAGLSAAYFEEGSGKYPLVESEAKRAVALKPTRVAGYRQLAVLYATAGRWDELERVVKEGRAAVPGDLSPEYHAARVIVVSNTGGQMARAEQYLRVYLAQPAEGQEPSHAAAHWRLGLALEKQERKDDAVRELREAVREDGSLEGARKDLKRLI